MTLTGDPESPGFPGFPAAPGIPGDPGDPCKEREKFSDQKVIPVTNETSEHKTLLIQSATFPR